MVSFCFLLNIRHNYCSCKCRKWNLQLYVYILLLRSLSNSRVFSLDMWQLIPPEMYRTWWRVYLVLFTSTYFGKNTVWVSMYYNMHYKIWKAAEQKVLPQDMDAQFIESILFDRTLYKYEILGRMASTVRITKQHMLSVSLDIWVFHNFIYFLMKLLSVVWSCICNLFFY
jgi:hypothetical protein